MRQDRYSLHVDRTATIAEVALALGGDIHAHPPRPSGSTKAYVVAWKAALTVYYRTPRRPAKDWIDSGAVSMKLRRAVLATGTWERKTFDRAFRLRDRGPELLLKLGHHRFTVGGEFWIEKGSDGSRGASLRL